MPDGTPNVWMGLEQGFSKIGRVYGPDLMMGICEKTSNAINESNKFSHYLYGSTPEVINLLKSNLIKKFPANKNCWQLCSSISSY